jgi:hypothetical protein
MSPIGQPSPRRRHFMDVPQVVHSWSGGQAVAPQHVEPGAVQVCASSQVRQMRSSAQATAPQQDAPAGLQTDSPPQFSSTVPLGQSARAPAASSVTIASAIIATFMPSPSRATQCSPKCAARNRKGRTRARRYRRLHIAARKVVMVRDAPVSGVRLTSLTSSITR